MSSLLHPPMNEKRILITGAAGTIGSELVRQLTPNNKVYAIDTNESGLFELLEENKAQGWCHGRVADIKDREVVHDIFSDFKPQIVYHAAALKHVPLMELTPREAVYTNILGTLNLVEESTKWECMQRFVFISTDKAVQAASIMGATKRVSEIIVKNRGRGFVVVRFGNVLGSRGSVIPLWQKAINEGKKIKVTDERMTRYMMTIEEAVNLVIQAGQLGEGGEIFILPMGKPVNVLELAKKIVKGDESKIEMIGARPGEQLHETLMSEEEERMAVSINGFTVIK